ncbi:hypothetical protein BDF14DRAFT_1838811 [Spinellus fusiger]|nr:hypothetical protein BDF14DRAFT_1838811 [Spinellus fusiger]
MGFLLLKDSVLVRIASLLGLHDLLHLSCVNKRLQQLIYNNPKVWTSNHLFPEADAAITDRFVGRLVPRITRLYGIRSLRLIRLSLSWLGYLCIFDQFAHSVDYIDLVTTRACLTDLIYHLSIFAGNLAMLQHDNRIPITFRQYAMDKDEHEAALAATHYLGQNTWHNLSPFLSSVTLDDPPFERLIQFRVSSTDHADDENDQIRQLHFLTCFLAGKPSSDLQSLSILMSSSQQRQPLHPHPSTHYKRSREEETMSLIPYPKHHRHEMVSYLSIL